MNTTSLYFKRTFSPLITLLYYYATARYDRVVEVFWPLLFTPQQGQAPTIRVDTKSEWSSKRREGSIYPFTLVRVDTGWNFDRSVSNASTHVTKILGVFSFGVS